MFGGNFGGGATGGGNTGGTTGGGGVTGRFGGNFGGGVTGGGVTGGGVTGGGVTGGGVTEPDVVALAEPLTPPEDAVTVTSVLEGAPETVNGVLAEVCAVAVNDVGLIAPKVVLSDTVYDVKSVFDHETVPLNPELVIVPALIDGDRVNPIAVPDP